MEKFLTEKDNIDYIKLNQPNLGFWKCIYDSFFAVQKSMKQNWI